MRLRDRFNLMIAETASTFTPTFGPRTGSEIWNEAPKALVGHMLSWLSSGGHEDPASTYPEPDVGFDDDRIEEPACFLDPEEAALMPEEVSWYTMQFQTAHPEFRDPMRIIHALDGSHRARINATLDALLRRGP